nr:hypothetical protein [Tanacetum cinerariifolium]
MMWMMKIYEEDENTYKNKRRKRKKHSHKPKAEDTIQEKLYLLHMDLRGPMRVENINGKRYILVIVDDYSRFTWVKFLGSMDETPENAVVERRNRTLVEAACTMLIFSKAPLYLWAEVVSTSCYTQYRSLIRLCHNKTPYELMHDKKPDLTPLSSTQRMVLVLFLLKEGFLLTNTLADLVSNETWYWPQSWLLKAPDLGLITCPALVSSVAALWQWRDQNRHISSFSVAKA